MPEDPSIEALVRAIFDAYRGNDAERFLTLLHPDFGFTSPYDDEIDRAAFMERCWPGHHKRTGHDLQQIVVRENEAFVLYELETEGGARFRNVERFTFREGLLFCVEVFFGDPPAGHGRWTSEDIHAAATVRRLAEDRCQAIRQRDIEGTMASVAETAVMFDVVDPLHHPDACGMRRRMEDWFEGFAGPIGLEIKERVVAADGDTAFSYSLNRYSGDLKSGGSTDMWVRATACYRFKDGAWRLVHEHLSVPFDRNTGKPSLNSKP